MSDTWQLKETAPRDGTIFLTWDGDQHMVVLYCSCKKQFFIPEGNGEPHEDSPMNWDFTHWMHLPAPPLNV